MNQSLQEFFDSRGVAVRVDRQAGVIRGVKILGLQSRNQRSYLPEALARAAALYEEAKVNVNHPKGSPLGPRDYQDRIGVIRNVVARPDEGLFADFHFNPRHALAEQLLWDAEHAPENVGFSHNVEARTSRQGERVVVEAITKVQSVDLVADPATTRGLFESAAHDPPPAGPSVSAVTIEELQRLRPDLVEELGRQQAAETLRLRQQVERLEEQQAAQDKRRTARRLLGAFGLPDPDAADAQGQSIVSPRFLETLLAAPDESAMRELIEERAKLVEALHRAAEGQGASAGKPLSRDQSLVYGAEGLDAKTFVEAIT